MQTPRIIQSDAAELPATHAEALLRIVAATAAGIAITGAMTFVLGLVGGIYPLAFLGWIAVLALAFVWLGDSPFRRRFWAERLRYIRSAYSMGAALVYILALIAALPAILPETQFDPLFSYHVLAFEWAQQHHIFVDIWRRSPYYAVNWVLIDIWPFELGLSAYVNFLAWLSGCLSFLGIYAFIVAMGSVTASARNRFTLEIAGCAGALSLALSPIYLRWSDTGMVDIPIGFFFLVAAACAGIGFISRWKGWLTYFVASAGFFIGMKTSLIVFVLPMAIVAAMLALRAWTTRRAALVAIACFLALSAPWYVKNFIQAGDPIAPVLNLAIHGVDAKFSKQDEIGQLADLQQSQSLVDRLRLPFDIVFNIQTQSFREYGTTLLIACLPIPAFVFAYVLLRRRMNADDATSGLFLFSALLVFAIGYWLGTSHLARYILLFYAAMAAFVPATILYAVRLLRLPEIAALALIALTAVPASAGAWTFVNNYWQANFLNIAAEYQDRDSYLVARISGYNEEQFLSRVLLRNPNASHRVYVVNSEILDYFFAVNGVTAIGDWFGPERYSDMDIAIDRNEAVRHLQLLGADAVMIPASSLAVPEAKQRALFRELEHAGFHRLIVPNSTFNIFVGPDIPLS